MFHVMFHMLSLSGQRFLGGQENGCLCRDQDDHHGHKCYALRQFCFIKVDR